MRFLVTEDKADVNQASNSGVIPLLIGADNGHEAVVRFLVTESKATVDQADNDGTTPLQTAAHNDCRSVVRILVRAGAPGPPSAMVRSVRREELLLELEAGAESPAQTKLQTMVAAGTVTGNAASSYPWQKHRGNANQELHVAKLEARREALRRFDLSLDDNTALLAEWMELIKELDVVMCLDLASSPTT